MERATISEIKSRLSAYLKKVKAGHSILILDRNQPVARLERVEAAAHPEDRVARLERAGLLRRATGQVSPATLRGPVPKPKRSVVEALLEERQESR
jgi:antitoxin (DNA-binding transcriptional repressor) of toxin-antitoxin stability system